ncbi:hypothetical protein llap_11832 [Limosa lapponica baueri]|uniref:Uncharacterized protein n=1 Tax=Limosa lapponica baueri TaxID=1758121 RepID=A0A2I0TVP2_LIMLA|nr:hypothetical protein llap_11832 [Limosa lapponica baueri]
MSKGLEGVCFAMDLSPVRVPCDRPTGGRQRGGGHCGPACAQFTGARRSTCLCGVKAASKEVGWGGGDNVELLSGSSQQVCSPGVGVGVREQGWELRGEGDGRGEDALLQYGSGLKEAGEEEVVPAGRKGHGDGNDSSEGVWGLLAISLTGKPVSGPVLKIVVTALTLSEAGLWLDCLHLKVPKIDVDPLEHCAVQSSTSLILFSSAGLIPSSASERDGQENWLYQEQSYSFVLQNREGLGF